jgi:general secretion pathway protein F
MTPFETSVLEVGERTGEMADALARLADFLESQAALRSRLLSALLYPAIVATLAVLLGGGVLAFLLPRVRTLLAQAHLPPNRFTSILLAGGRIGGILLLLAAALGLAGFLFARHRARRSEEFRIRLERALARMPFPGRAWRSLATLRFVRVLSLLLSRRVDLLEAVPLAARASGSAAMARDALDAAGRIRQGEALADALPSMPLLHESLATWMRAGEAAGAIVPLLDHAGDRLEAEHDRRAGRGVLALEVSLTLAVGAGVALVALAVLLPILQINQGFAP